MRATLIFLGLVNACLLAALIARLPHNRVANRLLAGLLVLVAMRLGIYVLGFAGAYDDHPWLTFLPLDGSAGFAPLLWLYGRAVMGPLPERWAWHLAPAAGQFLYQALCFPLPPEAKWTWYTTGHMHVVAPAGMMVILISATFYTCICWRDHARYQAWLDTRFAGRERPRLDWLRWMIVAFALALLLTTAAGAWHMLVGPLDYFARTPVLFGFCILAYVLGLLGWRHGGETYPCRDVPRDEPAEPRTDYAALASAWTRRIEAEGWWREEGLALGSVARRLATSERTLSRALNDGAGLSFQSLVNGMRVRAIQHALEDPGEARELLVLAFEHGFASKASFNRAFRQVAGMPPSAWRRSFRQASISAEDGAIDAAF